MILEQNSDHRRVHKFVIAIILFETISCSGLNLTTPNSFENMCEQYNTVIHDDRSNNMTYKINKFCSDYYFGLKADSTKDILVKCSLKLIEKGCSMKEMCLSKILNDEKYLKSLYCLRHIYSDSNCVKNFESRLNIKIDQSILQVVGSEFLLENILGACTSLSGTSIFKGFFFIPFCSHLNIKVNRDSNGNIDFSVWKSASTKLACKLLKL